MRRVTDQFPDPIIATLSLPMMEDDVNVRIRVVASDKKGRSGYERYARDRTDIERRDVMAAFFADRCLGDAIYNRCSR
jgi:hypothetical protein